MIDTEPTKEYLSYERVSADKRGDEGYRRYSSLFYDAGYASMTQLYMSKGAFPEMYHIRNDGSLEFYDTVAKAQQRLIEAVGTRFLGEATRRELNRSYDRGALMAIIEHFEHDEHIRGCVHEQNNT